MWWPRSRRTTSTNQMHRTPRLRPGFISDRTGAGSARRVVPAEASGASSRRAPAGFTALSASSPQRRGSPHRPLEPPPFRRSRGAKCLANVWKRCTAFHSVAQHCTCQQAGCQKRDNPLGTSSLSAWSRHGKPRERGGRAARSKTLQRSSGGTQSHPGKVSHPRNRVLRRRQQWRHEAQTASAKAV